VGQVGGSTRPAFATLIGTAPRLAPWGTPEGAKRCDLEVGRLVVGEAGGGGSEFEVRGSKMGWVVGSEQSICACRRALEEMGLDR
jgi:hypothetical protein